VRGVDHRAATAHLFFHETIEIRDAFGIEGGKRLVEEPKRRLRHEQARERGAPALSLARLAHLELRHAEPRQRRASASPLAARPARRQLISRFSRGVRSSFTALAWPM
jgi:hypothetical protein